MCVPKNAFKNISDNVINGSGAIKIKQIPHFLKICLSRYTLYLVEI